jgi:hypothetical protein
MIVSIRFGEFQWLGLSTTDLRNKRIKKMGLSIYFAICGTFSLARRLGIATGKFSNLT